MDKSKWVDHLVADLEQTFAKTLSQWHQTQSQEVCFWGPEGYAIWLHRLRAWHRSQLGENLSHHKDGLDSEYKGGSASCRVPRRTQPIHLVPRRMRSPPLSTLEESRPLQMDIQGLGGT